MGFIHHPSFHAHGSSIKSHNAFGQADSQGQQKSMQNFPAQHYVARWILPNKAYALKFLLNNQAQPSIIGIKDTTVYRCILSYENVKIRSNVHEHLRLQHLSLHLQIRTASRKLPRLPRQGSDRPLRYRAELHAGGCPACFPRRNRRI